MKNFYYLNFLFLILIGSQINAQQNFWLQGAGGSGNDEALAVANYQNFTYTTGYYSENGRFGNSNFAQIGSGDIFVSKQSPSGEYLWTKTFGTPYPERGLCITTLTNGNIVVGGTTTGIITFGNTQYTTNNFSQDIFIVCLNPQGNVLWSKLIGNEFFDEISDIKADAENNIYFTGRFIGELQIGNETLISGTNPDNEFSSTYDILISKLDENGNHIWTNHGKTNRNDRSLQLAIAPDNSIYATGIFSNAIEFTNTLNSIPVPYPNTSFGIGFLMKMTSNGNISWFRRIWSGVTSIEGVSCNANSVFIAGNFKGKQKIATTNNPSPSSTHEAPVGTNKYYLASFTHNGALRWCKTEHSTNEVNLKGVTAINQFNVAIVGQFKCKHSTYNSFYGEGLFISRGESDIFTTAFDSSGNRIWAKQIGSIKEDDVWGITKNSSNNPVFVGSFGENLASPARNSWGFKPWYSTSFSNPHTVCDDNNYQTYAVVQSNGNKDILIANIADTTRRTLDAFKRENGTCEFGISSGTIIVPPNPCDNDSLTINLPTLPLTLSGFHYSYNWNNGSGNLDEFLPSQSGVVTATLTARNTCFSFSDTIAYESLVITPTPTITNNYGQQILINPQGGCDLNLVLIAGESVTFTGNAVSGIFESFWTLPNGTVVNENVITTSTGGVFLYTIQRVNGGCEETICIKVQIYNGGGGGGSGGGGGGICENISRPLIPEFVAYDDFMDTLRGCVGSYVQIGFVDSLLFLSDNNTIINLFAKWEVVSDSPSVIVDNSNLSPDNPDYYTIINHEKDFVIRSSGTSYLKIQFLLPPESTVPFYTYYQQFYVDALPLPEISGSVSGDFYNICPSDTPLVIITTDAQSIFYPSGIFNIDTLQNPSSFQTLTQGASNVGLSSTLTYYTATGIYTCIENSELTYFVKFKDAPDVFFTPSDGFICENSTLLLSTIPADSVSWIGPTNTANSINFTYPVNIQGLYYAFVRDTAGCGMISEIANVREFSTPIVILSSDRLCIGDSIEITLELLEGDSLIWQAPLSGSSFTQIVSDTGTYRYTLFGCGTAKVGTIDIKASEIQAKINLLSDSVLCHSDTAKLKGNIEPLTSLLWLETDDIDTLLLINDEGIKTYTLKVTDEFQCVTYDTVTIRFIDAITGPIYDDSLRICLIDDYLIELNDTNNLYWFVNDSLILADTLGIGFNFLKSYKDSTITVAYIDTSSGCYSPRDTIILKFKPNLSINSINDTLVCSDQPFVLNFPDSLTNIVNYKWILPDSSIIENSPLTLESSYSGLYQLIATGTEDYCEEDTITFNINRIGDGINYQKSIPRICSGEDFTISVPEDSLLSISWSYQNINSVGNSLTIPANSVDTGVVIIGVKVVHENGCIAYDTVLVDSRLTPPSPPSVDSIIECGTNQLLIFLDGQQPFYWFLGEELTSNEPSLFYNYTYSSNNEGLYIANYDSIQGCYSIRTEVPVLIKPYFSLPILPTVTKCVGENVQFSSNPISSGAINNKWMFNNTIISTDSLLIMSNLQVNQQGIYTLMAEGNSNYCGRDTIQFILNVSPLPLASVTSIPANNICRGSNFEVTYASAEPYTSTWLLSNGSTLQNTTLQFNPYNLSGNIFNVTLQLANGAGCQSFIPFSIPVFNPPLPPPTVSTITLCGTLPALIDLASSYSVVWYLDDEIAQSTPSSSFTLLPDGLNSEITIANFDATTNCTSQTVIVPYILKPYFELAQWDDLDVCKNEEVSLPFDPIQENAQSYNWTNPANQSVLGNQIFFTEVQPTDSGLYTLIAQGNDNFCGSDTMSFNINVLPLPTPQILTSALPFCTAYNWQTYVNQISGNTNFWNYNGATLVGDTVNFLPNTLDTGNFDVILEQTAANGCSAKDTATITVQLSPAPPPPVDSLFTCAGQQLNINLAPSLQVYWFEGNTSIQTFPSSSFVYEYDANDAGLFIANYDPIENCYSTLIPIPIELKPNFELPLFSDTAACVGDSITFVFLPNEVNATTYNWINPANEIINDSLFRINEIALLNGGIYRIIATGDSTTCGSDTTGFTFTVNPLPFATITTSNSIICTNRLWSAAVNPSSNYVAQWSYNNFIYDSDAVTLEISDTVQNPATIYLNLTSTEGCKWSDSILVNVYQTPAAPIFELQDSVCFGDTIILNVNLQGATIDMFTYQSNANFSYQSEQLIYYPDSTDQVINIIGYNNSGFCISDTISNSFNVGALPIFNFQDTLIYCLGDVLTIQSFGNYKEYSWNDGSSKEFLDVQEPGYYTLTVTDFNGCIWKDSVYAFADFCDVDPVPNVFTPNGDSYNDKFILEAHGMTVSSIVIFDRWGTLIAEYTNIKDGWDGNNTVGSEMPSGVYFYTAKAEYINGNIQEIKGYIQLIR